LLQAQASKAKVIGSLTPAAIPRTRIKQAAEFGIVKGAELAGLLVFRPTFIRWGCNPQGRSSPIHSIGTRMTRARAAKRFAERNKGAFIRR
jgi:hypothetical protein